jgi:hypothetical protein
MTEPMLPSERLKTYGWTSGKLKSPFTGERCLLGALVEDPIIDADSWVEMEYLDILHAANEAYGDKVRELIEKTFAEYTVVAAWSPKFSDASKVYHWNDSVCNTQDQAVAMLESVGL